jgi:hypothetical protein
METENNKLKLIGFIDQLREEMFKGTTYDAELKMLRKKYIYKDISRGEFLRDVEYLTNMKNINYYYENK